MRKIDADAFYEYIKHQKMMLKADNEFNAGRIMQCERLMNACKNELITPTVREVKK